MRGNISKQRPVLIGLLSLFFTLSPCHLLTPSACHAQEPGAALRMSGFMPAGVRGSVTEKWGTLLFDLHNLSDEDREARVLVSYTARPDVQYGRDLWIPAHSFLKTWMLVGPAPAEGALSNARELRIVFQERTGKKDQTILPRDEERIRTQLVFWHKQEPSTSIMLGDDDTPLAFGELPRPDSARTEAHRLVRTFRAARELSEHVSICPEGPLCPVSDGLDGADHFVLASGRIADDPAGMRSLRQWVQRGGSLWVMLDQVDPQAIAPLLGEALDFDVVDRTSLTDFAVERSSSSQAAQNEGKPLPGAFNRAATEPPFRPGPFDRPVDFVRVLLPPGEQAKHVIDGWPVWFTRHVGHGRVVFTTLGPRGWYRERKGRDPRSPFERFPELPMPSPALEMVAAELQPIREDGFPIDSLTQGLVDDVGYSTVRRSTAVGVFGGFLLATIGLVFLLRRSRRPEILACAAPAAALLATFAFVALGEASRRAAPTTLAVGQLVEGDSATQDASVGGLMAVYRPDSGAFPLAAERGGIVELDRTGVQGQTTRLLTTDLDRWHLENLDLPGGLRMAHFRQSILTDRPIAAVARFGPDGLEGKIEAGPLRGLCDAVLDAPGDRHLAVRIQQNGSFQAGSKDLLPLGEFLAGTLLSDKQQRRQEIYRRYLKRPPTGRREERTFLLAWADPIDMGVYFAQNVRTTGSSLVILPLRLEHSLPGSRVTIPGPFIKDRRIWNGGESGVTRESESAVDMHLRFQLPAVVLPFKVERARLTMRMDAPSRRVAVAGWQGPEADSKQRRVLHSVESPLDVIRVDISDESLLRLDGDGGLHLNVDVGALPKGKAEIRDGSQKWVIHYIDLDITGRVE